jgi:hypothetical protein
LKYLYLIDSICAKALILHLFDFGLPGFGLTAGVTGKGGNWRTKLPDAESAVWGRFPASVGECPHLSGARGVGQV